MKLLLLLVLMVPVCEGPRPVPPPMVQAPIPPQAPPEEILIASIKPRTCPAGVCVDCRCVDETKCRSGECPASSPAPLPGYAACCEAVSRGEMVTLSVGVNGGTYHVDTLPGFEPGVYTCWRANGRHLMERRISDRGLREFNRITDSFPPAPSVGSFPASPCPGGVCPAPSQHYLAPALTGGLLRRR